MGYIYALILWLRGLRGLRGYHTLHCWHDSREGFPDAQGATCLLRYRHWGPHRFTLDSDVKLKFEP